MKNFWLTMTQKEAVEKAKELSQKHGCKFQWYCAHGGIVFSPVVERSTAADADAAAKILPFIPNSRMEYTSAIKLHDASKLPIAKVLEGMQWLIKNNASIKIDVNRAGGLAYIRIHPEWAK